MNEFMNQSLFQNTSAITISDIIGLKIYIVYEQRYKILKGYVLYIKKLKIDIIILYI